jgi:hypothetical protein
MGGLVGEGGCMNTADHGADAATAELAGQVVSVRSGRRRRGNRHQIGRHVESHRLDDFVDVRDLVLGRRERRDERHRELGKLNQTTAAKTPRLRRLRRDQVNTHEPDATGDERFDARCSGAPNRASPRVE